MEPKPVVRARGRTKYANAEEARLANLEKSKERGKTQEYKDYQKLYYQKKKEEREAMKLKLAILENQIGTNSPPPVIIPQYIIVPPQPVINSSYSPSPHYEGNVYSPAPIMPVPVHSPIDTPKVSTEYKTSQSPTTPVVRIEDLPVVKHISLKGGTTGKRPPF